MWPGGPLLSVAVVAPTASLMLWPLRVFIFAAPVSAMPALTSTVHSLAGFDQRSQTQQGAHSQRCVANGPSLYPVL